jgi:hypothetical protein
LLNALLMRQAYQPVFVCQAKWHVDRMHVWVSEVLSMTSEIGVRILVRIAGSESRETNGEDSRIMTVNISPG